jgi:hypothetical protein
MRGWHEAWHEARVAKRVVAVTERPKPITYSSNEEVDGPPFVDLNSSGDLHGLLKKVQKDLERPWMVRNPSARWRQVQSTMKTVLLHKLAKLRALFRYVDGGNTARTYVYQLSSAYTLGSNL